MTFVYANLTCKDQEEAKKIGDELLAKRLIACAKILSQIESTYWWKGNIENTSEVLLVMETHESRFGLIEEAIKPLHSYETFVLTATPMVQVSKNARLWLQESLNMLGA